MGRRVASYFSVTLLGQISDHVEVPALWATNFIILILLPIVNTFRSPVSLSKVLL